VPVLKDLIRWRAGKHRFSVQRFTRLAETGPRKIWELKVDDRDIADLPEVADETVEGLKARAAAAAAIPMKRHQRRRQSGSV
jgi:hypothetical protein